MLKFALKNMATKKAKIFLIILSIVISSSVALLAYNISEQIQNGIVNTAAYYDIIIGPSGSSTQLAMNTMFFTDTPLGTIPYEYAEKLQNDERVNVAVPFAMGDSYNSAKIVGTKPEFLEGKEIAQGKMFSEEYEAVIGSAVAKTYGLSIGDSMITSHGISETGEKHEATPLTVVGILDATKTAYDNTVFTDIETVWALHNHEDEHDEHDFEEVGGEHEEHTEEGTVCAILVKSTGFGSYYSLTEEYGKDTSLLVINPSTVLREVLDNVDLSKQIVYILCIIILIMNIFVISSITMLNMYDSQKEIALMRLIGISVSKVNLLFFVQNAIIGLVSTLVSFGVSRLFLKLVGGFVSSMGIVLDIATVYPLEYAIMALVFVISVAPTLICTVSIAKKDIIRN